MRENNGRDEPKIYQKHVCKYHNVSPVQILYANNNNNARKEI
jgi:hypothetical protein